MILLFCKEIKETNINKYYKISNKNKIFLYNFKILMNKV